MLVAMIHTRSDKHTLTHSGAPSCRKTEAAGVVGGGKKSVKYCNLFINIVFTRPRFEAINNDDTCELELTGSCGVCHIRISR